MRPELDENQVEDAVRQVSTLIQNLGGEIQRTDTWGKRRLAYEVNRLHEGYYVLTEFGIDQPRLPELESTLRISDTVFRHVVVRKPPPTKRYMRPVQPSVDGAGSAAPQTPAVETPQETSPEPAAEASAAPEDQPLAEAEEEAQV